MKLFVLVNDFLINQKIFWTFTNILWKVIIRFKILHFISALKLQLLYTMTIQFNERNTVSGTVNCYVMSHNVQNLYLHLFL